MNLRHNRGAGDWRGSHWAFGITVSRKHIFGSWYGRKCERHQNSMSTRWTQKHSPDNYGNFVSKSAASDIGFRRQLNALGISGFDKLMILFDEENNILEVSRSI